MPAQVLGQPAADHRRDDGRENHPDAPNRQRLAMLFRWIAVQHQGLGDRDHGGRKDALESAVEQYLSKRRRIAGKYRACGEPGQRNKENLLAADPAGEPAGGRHGDGLRHEIGRHYPGNLVLAGRQPALHVGQGDGGDGLIGQHHGGGHHGDHRDHGAVCLAWSRGPWAGPVHSCLAFQANADPMRSFSV